MLSRADGDPCPPASQHTSAYVSICGLMEARARRAWQSPEHMLTRFRDAADAYVSIRQQMQRCCRCIRQHTSADSEMLPMHTSAYLSRFRDVADALCLPVLYVGARTLHDAMHARYMTLAMHVPPSDTAAGFAGFEEGLNQLSSLNSSRMTYADVW